MLRLAKLKKLVVTLTASILIFALPVSAFADSIALTLNGIQGSSITGGPGAIDVLSFSFGASESAQPATGTGITPGKTQYSDISIMKNIDKSSLPILLHLATGKKIASGTLHVRKTQGQKQIDYFTVNLKNIVITGYQISAATDGGRPAESVSFQAEQMEFEYTDMKADGTPGTTDKINIDQTKNIAK